MTVDLRRLRALTDHNSVLVVHDAVEVLAVLRDLDHRHPLVGLHLLQSLTHQADACLAHTIADAHDHNYTHNDLRTVIGFHH
jgi:hypothetical protein